MTYQWKAFLEERATDWHLPTHGNWNSLLLNHYYPQASNVIMLWFHNSEKFPQIVTKLCAEESALTREFQSLTHVYSRVPLCAPRPLALQRHGMYWALWMEGVPGFASISQGYHSVRLQALVDMLATMHNGLRNNNASSPRERYQRMVLDPLRTLTELGAEPSVAMGCAELRSRISVEWLDTLPVIPQHSDLFPGNLLVHDNQCRAVDWESFGMVDLPFYDLLTLIVSLLTEGDDTIERCDRNLVRQVPHLIESYARQLGLRTESMSLLLPLALVNWLHVYWCDGHKKSTDRAYRTIKQYFDHKDRWWSIFQSA